MNLQLNYHHLRYFLAVANAGGIQSAAQAIHVSGPTLSAQVRELEEHLGAALFRREHRRMELTDAGRRVRRYAERIMNLGDELVACVHRGTLDEGVHLGVVDAVPKLVVSRLLRTAWERRPDLRVVVREGLASELIPAVVGHQVDLVIATEPVSAGFRGLLDCRKAAGSDVRFAVAPSLKARFRRTAGLMQFPVLIPTREAALRRELDQWWAEHGIAPVVRAEFDDAAAMYELASDGAGAAPVWDALLKDVKNRYGLVPLPVRTGIRETLYLVTAKREFPQDGVKLLSEILRDFE